MKIEPPRRLQVLVMHAEPLVAVGLAAALRQQPDVQVLMHGVDDRAGLCRPADVVVADYTTALGLLAAGDDGGGSPGLRGAAGTLAGLGSSGRFDASRASSNPGVPAARLLVVTARDREQDVRHALEAGVHGYLLLGCEVEELALGVRTLGGGTRYLCLAVAQRMADSLTREALTAREADVLRLLARGQCNKSIARQLDIAVGTVKAHVKAIMGKLEASCRTEAASIAAERGLVEEPAVPRLPARFAAPVAHRATRPALALCA